MAWKKSSEDLIERFYAALPDDHRVERRKMFGYPCAFVNGNMFTGLHQDDMIVRLPEARRAELLEREGARPFEPMKGRVMKEYVALPPDVIAESTAMAARVMEAFEFAAAMAPKEKKPRKKKAKAQ